LQKNVSIFFVGEDERKHKQGNGKENEEEEEHKVRIGWQTISTESRLWGKEERKNGSSFFFIKERSFFWKWTNSSDGFS
jgi:hypothetical protein